MQQMLGKGARSPNCGDPYESHAMCINIAATPANNEHHPPSTQLHHSLEFYDEPGLEASAQYNRQESTHSKEDKVVAYVVKVGIKLKYGHSQSEIEEHLKKSTSIVESSIPVPTK